MELKPSDNNNDDNNDMLASGELFYRRTFAASDCPMLAYVVRTCELLLLYKYECLPSRLLSVV